MSAKAREHFPATSAIVITATRSARVITENAISAVVPEQATTVNRAMPATAPVNTENAAEPERSPASTATVRELNSVTNVRARALKNARDATEH